MARIAQGGHFLSDVVFAGFINFAVAWALYVWLAARDGPGDRFFARWDASLGRTGDEAAGRGHALVGVVIAVLVGYYFLDRPALRVFLEFDREFHHLVKYTADYGRAVFWMVPAALAFAGLWLASRLPALAAYRDRLVAWSMLPLFLYFALTVTGIVAKLLKISIGRMRPLHDYRYDDYGFSLFQWDASYQSFPSGHAVTFATVAMALALILPRWRWVFLALGAIGVAARVLETAHWISDGIFGAYLGIVLTVWVKNVFARCRVDLPLAVTGSLAPGPKLPWRERLGLPSWLWPAAARR